MMMALKMRTLLLTSLLATQFLPQQALAESSQPMSWEKQQKIREAISRQREKEAELGEKLLQQKREQRYGNNPAAPPMTPRRDPSPPSSPAPSPDITPKTQPFKPESDSTSQPNEYFALDLLPKVIGGNWVLKYDYHGCSLYSLTRFMNDGVGTTPVTLKLSSQGWEVMTDSELEYNHPEAGLTLDSQTFFKLEQVERKTNGRFSRQSYSISRAMRSATMATVSLSFWPSWPVTDVISTTLSVDGFREAYYDWQKCTRYINQR